MTFVSLQFLFFFPLVLVLYFNLPQRLRWGMLLAASYYFYMAPKPEYGVLLGGGTIVCYVGALRIQAVKSRAAKRGWLIGCTVTLLGILFLFKYFNLFASTLRFFHHRIHLPFPDLPYLSLILPIGISFYTFQLLSYVIDVYRGRIPAERHLGIFALYASFFPQLVAGPIERASNLLPQFLRKQHFDSERVFSGLRLMAWGYFKKTMVADHVAGYVNQVYAGPQAHDSATLVMAVVLFYFQLYCDFSGYSDIAIGAARTMGLKLMTNFRQPMFARSIPDFWHRWHISLTTWLRDYLFKPLARTRALRALPGTAQTSLFITFVLSGLWHGASWRFVLWGGMHGLLMLASSVTRNWRRSSVSMFRLDRTPKLHHALQLGITFWALCLTGILFRAHSLADAWYVFAHLPAGVVSFFAHITDFQHVANVLLIPGHEGEFVVAITSVLVLVGAEALVEFKKLPDPLVHLPVWARWSVCYAALVCTITLGAFYDQRLSFVYFQF